ncbi:long-chain-fatty-acid--CoA ligase [Microbacterium amylolyticum]|uniref:Long-chain acyl-CoA synthetase n=1 Tax=Microbacterium amylolyticum TaxID=936337 RepID=A0ABS4ZEN3_9MICO|nr:long-chain-fatty-acid--CoA ligase [Microbacterium amylolyticum]MBP2435747.1 long-chain acyl-CoA synthetase [Microbacterium amylolyticum]
MTTENDGFVFAPPRPWVSSYADGVPHDLAPISGSLMDLVADSAAEHPDAPALEFFGRVTTYAELIDAIERAANGLRQRGVKKGDTVAIVLPNCSQHIIAFYAVLRLGAIVVEHNPLYTPRELRKQFEDHGARHAIVWSKVASTIQDFPDDLVVENLIAVDVTKGMPAAMQVALKLPFRKLVDLRDQLTEDVVGGVSWEAVVSSEPLGSDVASPDTDDIAVIQYTSGTTGTPKGASLTHRNLLANAMQARAWIPQVTRGEGTVFYAVLPMFHAYGLTLCLTFAMSQAARLVLFPKFDPDMVLKATKKRPATVLPLVPPIADRLMRRAQEKGMSIAGTGIGVSGAMALDDALVTPWEQLTGGILVEGYGLSECSPVLMVNPVSDKRRAGSIGLPVPGTEVRVVDPEEPTRDVGVGQPGELLVRGPQVFSGYYGRPEETEQVFVDGWFRTGDVVEMDDEGFFTVVDRIKELIITGGFNVAPTEVEMALRQHPAIADAAVVGLPSPDGEEVVAAVVLDGSPAFDPEEVRGFVKQVLTPYKAPRRLFIVDELPKSMIGKVLRRQVKEQLLARDAS